jgi:hypothetical protein
MVIVDGHVYVLVSSPSAHTMLHSAHGVGHEGIAKTLHRLWADFHMSGARTAI